MAREIIVDTNTVVGYSYILKKYYVQNQGTLTYRDNIQDTLNVLGIVAPLNTVTVQDLQNLHDTYEVLKNVYYTLNDTGSFVSSIQFNTYREYPLVLNCYKSKLYIGNSNIIFDLTLNESIYSRVHIIREFYRDFLGLDLALNPDTQEIDLNDLEMIYDLLLSYYTSNNSNSIYNIIDNSEEKDISKLKYSDTFSINNWDNKSLAVYNCIINPYGEYISSDIGDITDTNTSDNTITTLSNISNLSIGDKVKVTGIEEEYSPNGEYTVLNIEDNVVTTKENISGLYNFPFPVISLQTSKCTIHSIDRDTSTITLHNSIPDTIQVGNVIYVQGTQVVTDNQTLTCDGYYTVGSIDNGNKKIVIQEVFPTNFSNPNNAATSYISKHLFISNILSINNKVVQLQDTNTFTLTDSTSKVVIYNNTNVQVYTVANHTSNTITVSEAINNYNPTYPKLQKLSPDTSFQIQVTSTTNTSTFPITTFIVDNFTQVKEYISLFSNLLVPTDTIYNNIYNKVPDTKSIPLEVSGITSMEFLGLFNTVYSDLSLNI